jgi:hypothetical protein
MERGSGTRFLLREIRLRPKNPFCRRGIREEVWAAEGALARAVVAKPAVAAEEGSTTGSEEDFNRNGGGF